MLSYSICIPVHMHVLVHTFFVYNVYYNLYHRYYMYTFLGTYLVCMHITYSEKIYTVLHVLLCIFFHYIHAYVPKNVSTVLILNSKYNTLYTCCTCN